MPSDVAKSTVTSTPAAADNVTVILVAVLFSFDVDTSLIDKDGVPSSLVIVKVSDCDPPLIDDDAPETAVIETTAVSLAS